MADEIDLTVVVLRFRSSDPGRLVPALAKYVVLSRGHDGCRNIDFCTSVTAPDTFVIIEKWASPAAQRAHFDSKEMVEMAEACRGLLRDPPAIDLLTGISAHDLS